MVPRDLTQRAPPTAVRASAPACSQRDTGKSELRRLNKAEVYQRATDYDVAGRSKMSREELIDALARAGLRPLEERRPA
ncbi:Rho termination factor N-terminal domain-containing protein [Streptomyces sp. NPDC001920]